MENRHIAFSPPDITEEEIAEVVDALKSGWITTGPKTKRFENELAEYMGTSKVACLNSATAAAELILRVLGIGEGDEVITTAYTYTATASVIAHVGAKIVMVDVDKDSYQMNMDQVEAAVTEKTKAIIMVDLGGRICDYTRVFEIAEEKKHLFQPKTEIQKKMGRIAILSDAAHAMGAKQNGKMCGSIADFTSFSFHAVKNLTTAEGGALTWNLPFGEEPVVLDLDLNPENAFSKVSVKEGNNWNQRIYRICQLLSLHGQNKDALAKTKLGAWEYDIVGPWFKCNMTDVIASLGLIQFERYPEMLVKRKEMIEKMDTAFADINVAVLNHYGKNHASSGHLYIVRLLGKTREQTNEVIEKMAERGIATNVHYKPLPMMTAYKKIGFDIKDFPNAYHMFENEITLPLNTKMTMEDVDYVIENFVDIVKSF